MEKMGIPSVPIVHARLQELAKLTAAERGMPTLRIVFTVHPIWGKTPEELCGSRKGPDPITGKPMMKEILDDLTTPLSPTTRIRDAASPAGPGYLGPDTLDNLQAIFMNNGMTDYMPIIIPTEEKVDAMLKGTSHSPDELLRTPAPGVGYTSARWGYTVRQVAVNAVMAGCRPEYFPGGLAMASDGPIRAFRLHHVVRAPRSSSTVPFATSST